jgi:hypothetical protein
MEKDLIIGEPEENKPGEEVEIDEDEVLWDETTAAGYVDTAQATLTNLCSLDEAALASFTELERAYIKKTKKMCIRIMHHYVKDIFTDMIDTQETEEEKK